jgi:alcohol dehydrogenase (cytochrome c)
VTAPFVKTNWAEGIDSRGEPIPNPKKEPKPDGTLVSPGSDGATNWLAPSFNPETQLFYVSARRLWSIFYMTAEGKPEGWAGRDRNLWANSVLVALDYKTGAIRWQHELGAGEGSTGMLSTAGDLLFTADNSENLLALDPKSGQTIWHVNLGAEISSAPSTFELDGRQYLLVPVGGDLMAWALPKQ